jgi:hypothetical protein
MCAECNARFTFAFLIIIALILIYIYNKKYRGRSNFSCDDDSSYYPGNMSLGTSPDKLLYSAADVDPIITANLHKNREEMKGEYTQRITEGGSEFGPNYDSNINISYSTQIYDDGMPSNWILPSTPIETYRPPVGDYYGDQGITPYTKDLYSQSEPDHEPAV